VRPTNIFEKDKGGNEREEFKEIAEAYKKLGST
jgi:hypothetical protein